MQYATDLLKKEKELVILVPAEGSRSAVEKWRTGFYHIAKEAKAPISLGYLDYKYKTAGILGLVYPSDDFEKDMLQIQEAYKPIHPKYPEKYNPKIF